MYQKPTHLHSLRLLIKVVRLPLWMQSTTSTRCWGSNGMIFYNRINYSCYMPDFFGIPRPNLNEVYSPGFSVSIYSLVLPPFWIWWGVVTKSNVGIAVLQLIRTNIQHLFGFLKVGHVHGSYLIIKVYHFRIYLWNLGWHITLTNKNT